MPTPTSTTSPTAAHHSATTCITYVDDTIFLGLRHEVSVNEATLHPIERTARHQEHRPICIANNIRMAFDSVSRAVLIAHGIDTQPRASSSSTPNKLPSPSKYEEVD